MGVGNDKTEFCISGASLLIIISMFPADLHPPTCYAVSSGKMIYLAWTRKKSYPLQQYSIVHSRLL